LFINMCYNALRTKKDEIHMRFIIDVVLLILIAICTWNGYKKGLVGSIAGILVIVASLLGGTLFSSAFSHEVVPALEPFVNGYVDSQTNRDNVLEKLGYGSSNLSLDDILAQDSSLRYDYAYESNLNVGLYSDRAEELAEKSVYYAEENGTNMTDAVINVLCDSITYVGGLTIAFLLVLILLSAIGNLINLSFRLPNMENLDEIGGAVLGFITGFIFCVLACWVLSFFGILIGKETMEHTILARFFLMFRFITNGLM